MSKANFDCIVMENNGFNIQNEGLLHRQIKQWYYMEGDRLEAKVSGYFIDIMRDNILIEIQTKNFSAIRKKLRVLLEDHKVKLVYPIPKIKWITTQNVGHNTSESRRKSPKKGNILDIFDELIRIPDLINHNNFIIEVLLIEQEEIRCNDGRGSWRRKGVSIKDRKLLDVIDIVCFNEKDDFLKLLPNELDKPFSNKNLAKVMKISLKKAQKITYCLKKMGSIENIDRIGNELLYDFCR